MGHPATPRCLGIRAPALSVQGPLLLISPVPCGESVGLQPCWVRVPVMPYVELGAGSLPQIPVARPYTL